MAESRELTGRYLLSFCIAFVVWAASLAVPAPARYALWALAQGIEIANGPVTYLTIRNVPQQISHMDERFGLFVIIVLGEAVLQVALGIEGVNWQWRGTATAVAVFLIAGSMWWLYFLRADSSVIHSSLRSGRHALWLAYVYGYSHLFVFAGIAAAAVGAEVAIQEAPSGDLSNGAALVLATGLLAYLLGTTALQWAAPRSLPSALIGARLAAAVLVGVTLAGAGSLGAVATVAMLALLFLALATLETRGSPHHAAELDEEPARSVGAEA